jgi:hypothetical protein
MGTATVALVVSVVSEDELPKPIAVVLGENSEDAEDRMLAWVGKTCDEGTKIETAEVPIVATDL